MGRIATVAVAAAVTAIAVQGTLAQTPGCGSGGACRSFLEKVAGDDGLKKDVSGGAAGGATYLYYNNNLATLADAEKVLTGVSASESFAARNAPKLLSIMKSAGSRGALIGIIVGTGGVFLYESYKSYMEPKASDSETARPPPPRGVDTKTLEALDRFQRVPSARTDRLTAVSASDFALKTTLPPPHAAVSDAVDPAVLKRNHEILESILKNASNKPIPANTLFEVGKLPAH